MNDKRKLLRYLPAIVGTILAILLIAGIYLLQGMFEKPAQTKKQIQQISVVQPPPPPPPPPETPPPPPPPEEKTEKIEEPEPEPETPEPEAPPASEDLGVDAEGGAGSDGFGLVGKKGGRGLLGGGGGGNAFIYYGQQMQRELSEALQRDLDDAARAKKYAVVANVWIAPDGALSRAELSGGTGDAAADAALRAALSGLRLRLPAPPPGMPQPVKIRIRS